MADSKHTKRALLGSALALVLCFAMLLGTTFAWFTDTAKTTVNKIESGTLDIEIVDEDGNKLRLAALLRQGVLFRLQLRRLLLLIALEQQDAVQPVIADQEQKRDKDAEDIAGRGLEKGEEIAKLRQPAGVLTQHEGIGHNGLIVRVGGSTVGDEARVPVLRRHKAADLMRDGPAEV